METLVIVVDQPRDQYYGKNRAYGSPNSGDFRKINCRTFNSGVGILPTSVKACITSVAKRGFGFTPSYPSPKTPSPASCNSPSEENTYSNRKRRIFKKVGPIPIHININVDSEKEESLIRDEFSYSELWAGPAYSNSLPPSCLPMPKFFVPPKRTVSLELPAASVADINVRPIARSAPPSPKRDHNNSARNLFQSADYASATKDLRRILNLVVC